MILKQVNVFCFLDLLYPSLELKFVELINEASKGFVRARQNDVGRRLSHGPDLSSAIDPELSADFASPESSSSPL